MRPIQTIILLSTIGCNSGFNDASTEASTTAATADTVSLTPCNATATTIAPASDGQTNFFYRDDIVFTVTDGAFDAQVELTLEDGTPVEGTTWIDDQVEDGAPLQVIFTPDVPLMSSTDYSAQLVYCGGSPSVSFSTSALGDQIQDPDLLTGWTYTMDLSAAKVVKPGSTAQAMLTLLDNDLALQVNAVEGDTLNITIAATDAASGEQDMCLPSLELGMAGNFSEAPSFALGPVDVPFTLAGYTVMLYDTTATATFASNGTYFAGGRLSGSLDARDVVTALAGRGVLPAETPEALCDILANVKLPCDSCRDGEDFCLNLEAANISGEQTLETLNPVEASNCHEDCATSCENDACDQADDFPVCES